MATRAEQLTELVRPVVEGLSFQLWGVEYLSRGRDSVFRIFIDKEAGIQLEDCEAVSRQVSALLDVEDPIAGEYNLEVSSPGLDRPLFELSHYEQYQGGVVSLKLRVAFEGRRKYKGLLKGIEDQDIVLECDGHEYLFPFDSIEKANLVPSF
ncbi:ribosome maturation factor RimP [Endozoicomonadaceae bacterium StTr2]